MPQHEKELLLICWHIGSEVVAKERYKIFFDLGECSLSIVFSRSIRR